MTATTSTPFAYIPAELVYTTDGMVDLFADMPTTTGELRETVFGVVFVTTEEIAILPGELEAMGFVEFRINRAPYATPALRAAWCMGLHDSAVPQSERYTEEFSRVITGARDNGYSIN